eukprot:7901972-Alexandrium_andersonii.AAC.1
MVSGRITFSGTCPRHINTRAPGSAAAGVSGFRRFGDAERAVGPLGLLGPRPPRAGFGAPTSL